MTTIAYRPQVSTNSITLPIPNEVLPTQTTKASVDTKKQGGSDGSPGIQFAKTSQARLTSTARAMQKATHALGEEFVALEAHLRGLPKGAGGSSALVKRNRLKTGLGNWLEKSSDATNFRLSLTRANPNGKVGRLAAKLLERKTALLDDRGEHFQYADVIDQRRLEMKLIMLFNYHPDLAEVIENACRHSAVAVLGHPASSSPRAGVTLDAVDDMLAQVMADIADGKSDQEIGLGLQKATARLEASGGLIGRASTRIKENPGNNEEIDARRVGHWIAQGKPVETTEAVRYGFINKGPEVVATEDQALLDKLLGVAGLDTAGMPANTPLLLRECGDRNLFSEKTEAALRARLIVDQPFDVIDPRPTSAESRPLLQGAGSGRITVEIEQVPMLLALKYVICGQEERVHQDVRDILDDARLVEAFSKSNPEFATQISDALRNPDNEKAMGLHRKLVAAELMNTFLEGGSAWDTAKDVAPYAGAGMVVECIKNVIPDGPLKSVVTELFLGGADLGDNGMGCMAELRSQAMTVKGIEVGGIADLYEKTFDRPASGMTTMLAHLALLGAGASDPASRFFSVAAGMGFEKPTGPLAAITETQMKSFLTGSAVSIGMTTLYSAAGAMSTNPAVLALFGALAIMGTSISPAIGFGMLHGELSLAVKKRLVDQTLQPPEGLQLDDHAAVTEFCSKEAMNQLMMQTGNGAGNIAFLLAPLASAAKLLGFVAPQELIDFVLEPLMPGMENIVRVGAMDNHEASKRDAIRKIKEKCIDEAARDNTAPMSLDEFDNRTLSRLDKTAAAWSLLVASPFVKLLGGSDYPHLVPVADAAGAVH